MDTNAMNSQTDGAAGQSTATRVDDDPTFKQLRAGLPAEQQGIADELEAIVRELEARGAAASATRVRRLDEYATALSPESLPGMIDSDAALAELEERPPFPHRAPWLTTALLLAARNVVALLPLLATWWSLSMATSYYQAEIRLHPSLIYQPFLILWENGFGQGMQPSFSFIAGLDTVFFIIIIVVTFGAHMLESRTKAEAQRLVARIDSTSMRLVATLGQSRAAFVGKPGDWAAAVRQVIKEAMAETRNLAKAGQEITRSAEATVTVATTVSQMSQDVVRQVAAETREYIAQAKAEFAATVQQLHSEFAETVRRFREEDQTFFEEANKAIRDQMGDLIVNMADRNEALFKDLHSAIIEANLANQRFLDEASKENLATFARIADGANQILQEIRAAITLLGPSAEQQRTVTQTLADTMVRVGDTTQRLDDTIQSIAGTAAAMDSHVQDVVRAHEHAAEQTSAVAKGLTIVIDETKSAAAGMRAASERMIEALSNATTLSGELGEANRQWTRTQQGFISAIGMLENVTRTLQDTARRLNELKVNVTIFGRVWPFGRAWPFGPRTSA